VDLQNLPEMEREKETQRLAIAEAEKPFDLSRDLMFRPVLLRLAPAEHVLLVAMHHIAADGWSLGVFYRDLTALYQRFTQNGPALPDLPIQYSDFALWQRQPLQGEKMAKDLAYWKKQLSGAPEILELPTDRPRPAVQTFRGAQHWITWPVSLTQALKALSRQHEVTLFMTLQAAFNVLLHRYTRQTDIVVGSPISGRTHVETEDLIGFFINTLVLRTDLSGNPTFQELLRRVATGTLDAYAHQDLPLELLVRELKPGRSSGHMPLFQVMFVLQSTPSHTFTAPGLNCTRGEVDNNTAKFDLTLSVTEDDGALTALWEYNRDLFDAATIQRMERHFQTLLEGVVAHPEKRLSELPLLTKAERQQLLTEWSGTSTSYPADKTVQELFEEQVERTPEAVALFFRHERITYQDLNVRANQLADYLQKFGVGPDVLVCVCLERSVELIVSLLGILKAGGAYVALDPTYPKQLLTFMLEDTQTPVLVTEERLAQSLPEFSALERQGRAAPSLICLDKSREIIARCNKANPQSPHRRATDLAYVSFTSGSTGKPKGVCVTHRGVVRLVKETNYARLISSEVFLQLAPISFDASTFEIWGCLLNGARLVIFPPEAPSLAELGDTIQKNQVTTLWLTAGLFHQMVEEQLESLQGVRQLLAGGDVLSPSHVKKAVEALSGCQVINGYGPTENTTFTCCCSINAPVAADRSISVGRPIANTQVYVLDDTLQPVPIGVPGELYAGGAGLARGYLNRPELTAEKFIPNPFSAEPGARLYKTGDLVRWLSDGQIEFLGRIDCQVKVRGFRIELGEIETVLAQHDAVAECVVVAREDVLGQKQLVAYVVAAQNDTALVPELRSFLKEKLPHYMVPALFVLLDALPLTENGKVNRRALPAPGPARSQPEDTYLAPQIPLEQTLAEIWAAVLRVDRVGVRDNFFELGGHSLLAITVAARIRNVLHVDVPLRYFFQAPTVAELAEKIKQMNGTLPEGNPLLADGAKKTLEKVLMTDQSGPEPTARFSEMKQALLEKRLRGTIKGRAKVQIAPRCTCKNAAPLSFAQQRLWFLDQLQPNSPLYNIPTAVRLRGRLDVQAVQRAVTAIIARHEVLRTHFASVEGEAYQVIAEPAVVEVPVKDLTHWPKAELEGELQRLLAEEARRPFDLACGPMLRALLVRLSETEHVFFLNMHHIASDGWSLGVFFHEFGLLYEAFARGETASLPGLPIQYADYAIWQREWLQKDLLEQQRSYWKRQLAGAPEVLELPVDGPRRAVQTHRGAQQTLQLPHSLSMALHSLSNKEGATLFMVLLAALKTLLYRYTRQTDLLIGSPIAGRNQMETEGLIGFFINTLVLRTDLAGNPTFREFLQQVRKVTLEAYAHQDLPFEKIVEELRPERTSSHTPLIQVMFVLQEALIENLRLPSLDIKPVEVNTGTAKFDLTLSMTETPEGLRAEMEYDEDLFGAPTITRMLEHFRTLLEGIVANPDGRLSQLPLLSSSERHQLLVEWNQTQRDYPKEKLIHQLFEAQAERTPEAVAVAHEGQPLTYAELNARANQLACYLRNLGAGPDVCVGVYLERSPDFIIALLAILKSGSAYLPMDRIDPKERIEFMVRDSEAPLLITEHRFVDELPSTAAKVIYLDVDSRKIAAEPNANLPSTITSENLAYVIYTSGSTGKPKGSCIPHRAVNRLVMNADFVQLGPSDVMAQVSNGSFDAATWEIWGALLNGAKLVIITRDMVLSPAEFCEQLRGERVTAMFLTTALFHQLASDVPGCFRTLRHLLVGGAAVEPRWVGEVLKNGPPQRLLNAYGPTETTTFATWHEVKAVREGAMTVPIGRPVANTRLYVLDDHMQPVPVGARGELYIGGDGVGCGYLQRPELTGQNFVPDPFCSEAGARLYKTGDWVRYLPDGNVEFIGRIDLQVKIRGFRVEIEEVESVLGQHPGVRECAVTARADMPGEKRLVAYVVLDDQQPPKLSELRDFLGAKLPEYMVPSLFVPMEALPLMPNRKVNRAALPAPSATRPELTEKPVAPRDALELQLARIWESVLGVHPIGLQDKFFQLGGHSLLAVKLLAKIEKSFGRRLSLAALFQFQTIEQMASVLRKSLAPPPRSAVVEVQPEGSKPPIFFVHGVGGGMFWGYINLARHLGTDQPVYALRSRGLDGQEEWGRIEEMATDYVRDVRAFQPRGPYYLGGYCFGGNVAYEMARQLHAQGEQVALLALINCAPPNSTYTRVKWTPLYCMRFLGNLFWWIWNFFHWPTNQRRGFFGWKMRVLKKGIHRLFHPSPAASNEVDVERVVNLSLYPEDQRGLWETHVRALVNYHPKSYPGCVTLFRSRGHPLLCSFDARFGWGDLAQGGVDLRFVSGGHERILEEPHVQIIARELKACLQQTHSREDLPGQSPPGDTSSDGPPEACPAGEVPIMLSSAQQRLWFFEQSHPDHHLQNRWQAWHLKGTLNLNALERGLREIVRRHESLRTRFVTAKGQAAQIVSAAVKFSVAKVDLQHLPEDKREEEASRLGVAEVGRRFDLNDDSMVRVTLFQIRPAEYRLLLVLHPLVADASSLNIFCTELTALYDAYCQGKSSPLPDLTARYAAFVGAPQQALVNSSKTVLNPDVSERPTVELPADHVSASVETFRSGTQSMKVPQSVSKALNLISYKNGVTLFMTLLAAFGTLVYRTTRQESFLLRASSPGRNRSEFGGLIGCFDTPLTLRLDLSGNPGFEELVCRIHRLIRSVLEEQNMEELIKDWESPDRERTDQPRIAFDVQNMEEPVLHLAGLAVMPWRLALPEPRFDLHAIFVATEDDQLTARLQYDLDRFEPATLSRWLGRLQTLLEGIVAQPEQRISELPILSSAERQQVLVDWNATEVNHPVDQTYAQAFETQAAQTPTAPAVRFQNVELTYAELNGRANRLAHYLQRLGVGPEVVVAVHIERSIDFAIAVLGVWKAGGAYLPLDSASPPERLTEMLSDSEASILLTTEERRPQFAATHCKVVGIDDLAWQSQFVDPPSQSNPVNGATAESLAYVIYTSGSTGKPKGVQIVHRSLLNHNFAVAKAFHLQASDRILQFSSLSFDISMEELFPGWLMGALIVMRPPDIMDSPSRFLEFVDREKITVLDLPTAFWHQLVSFLSQAKLPATVRLVVIGGEKASQHVYANWQRRAPDSVSLINTYGPTETTVTATLHVAGKDSGDEFPIGRPIDNVQVYLLDEHLEPVPVGTPGKLYIGGAGVGRGYLNRPDLTAEKFIPNPFRVGPNERLYDTGDLARYRSDGSIEFLGRTDDQVKIRGFRVELSEIESALNQHPQVKESVVIALADSTGEMRLAAYWVADEPVPADGALIQFLKQKLPEYMVPSSFTRLPTLPLSSHGKIDRKALPEPAWSRPSLAQDFVAPRTPTEEQLAKIWSEVLGLSRVGVLDNFFELGGHSLHAMQVAARVRDTFQEDLPLSGVFEMPTVAALGGFIGSLRRRQKSAMTEPIARASRDEALPLSFDQHRLWFLHQLEPASPVYNIAQAVRLVGKLNLPALEQSLNEMVRRHEALRTTFRIVEGQPVQNISPSAIITLARVDMRLIPAAQRGEALRRNMIEEARRPFDLTRDLMLRASLVQTEEADHVLLLTLHHIAADAWSIGVLLEELGSLYEAFSQEEPSPLAELQIQYGDFAIWQHRYVQGAHLEKELIYWERQLADAPALQELPVDRPRPTAQTFAGARQPLTLGRQLSEALQNLSRQENCTLFMTLLAAFQTLIARYTGRQDILVGSPIAHRTRPEVEKLIGFFVNTLVLRGRITDNPPFRKFLRQIRGTTLDAYAHQQLPFEKLVEKLQPKRDQSYHPLFQVMFVLQNVAMPAPETAGLSWRPFDVDIGTAKFDLTLELNETAEGLTGWFEYCTDLFDAATVARMAAHFQTLLEGIVANPDQRVSELPLISEAERNQLLVEWNDTAKPFPKEKCVHQLFEEQAARTPQATALIFQNQALTYRELNQRADQCAHRLRLLGVGPDVVVGLCVERSLEMVVALFGILKAGGAYLPMDPAYPRDRLIFMLEDARSPLLLTQRKLAPNFHTSQTRIVCLDTDDSGPAAKGKAAVPSALQSSHLVYVIYTSGSTGRPKGVALEHRNVVAFAHWAREVFSAQELAGVLFSTSICFDLSVFELFVPLSWGGTVILAENALQLPSLAAAEKVTLINTVPSAITELLRVNGIPPSACTVNLAGEPLSQLLVNELYQKRSIKKVHDLYGPTEDTVYSTFALRTPEGPATIGRPLSNEHVYLLDPFLQPVPIGVPGELHIGGAGLARGYLHQPELTRQKFIPNPFQPGSRLYKTGDRVRYLPDGRIEFLGRIDHQVKVRGYRIELGEIETQLGKHPNLRQAVVIAGEDRSGDKRLVAYVVPKEQPAPEPNELRAFLQKKLPDYMVPSLFLALDELPQTPNGKIDRKALPDPDKSPAQSGKTYTAPRTTVETILTQIWCEVLDLPQVGIHSNFFELGGHSLRVTKVLARLREALQVDLPMRVLFEAPTVAALALVVEEALVEEIASLSEEEVQQLEASSPSSNR
jgi:amino acid adenylation domain-containing protein